MTEFEIGRQTVPDSWFRGSKGPEEKTTPLPPAGRARNLFDILVDRVV